MATQGGWGSGPRKFMQQHPPPEKWNRFVTMMIEGVRHREKTGKSMKVPRFVLFVDELPHTPTHKVAKHVMNSDKTLKARAVDLQSGG